MSELRIALVAEGPTDLVIIEAALMATLDQPFILTQLQPEATYPERGNGWGGVLRWCDAAKARHTGHIEDDPTLEHFDLVIIHLDVDVALKDYSDCGQAIATLAQQNNWHPLPCAQVCPPVSDTCDQLQQVIRSWLQPVTPGSRTVFCLPAQSSGTWLAAAVLPAAHPLLVNAECNPGVEDALPRLTKRERIRKSVPEYRNHAHKVKTGWPQITSLYHQAQTFEGDILLAANALAGPGDAAAEQPQG